jgi:Phosphodiester glycosidase
MYLYFFSNVDAPNLFLSTLFSSKSFRNQGLTLAELANVMIAFQAAYAINFDGGSSSVMVHQSTVISRPSCISIPIVRWLQCERPVGSTICIR